MLLRPWQVHGALWLAERRRAILADEMRVGKTLTALTAARLVRAKRILILCPAFARENWRVETERAISDMPVSLIKTKRQLQDAELSIGPNIFVSSYGLIPKLEAQPWDLVIADESHFLRSCPAARTRLVLGKGGLVHRAARFWALSGTPAVNHYGELWTLLHVFGAYPGSYEKFTREFCTMRYVRREWIPSGSKNVEALRILLEPVMLRRRFAEVAPEQLPIEFSTYVLDAKADFGISYHEGAALELALDQGALSPVSGEVSTLRRLLGRSKVPAAVELLTSELADTAHKLVIFAVHREVVAKLAEGLAQFNPVVVNGAVSSGNRDAALLRFKTDPQCRVFIGNIISAGTAIDLSIANEIVFVESSWVPGENHQAAMRLQNMNRIGGVTARFLSTSDLLDKRITQALARKTQDLVKLFDNDRRKA